jgi:hypothetical protein
MATTTWDGDMDSDLVLGVALAPTALGLVLVRGSRVDGDVLDRDLIETATAADSAKASVLRTYSTATRHGYRIRGVGVTCIGENRRPAVDLAESLNRLGVRNVVVVEPDTAGTAVSAAAVRALEMVRVPDDTGPLRGPGRHRTSSGSSFSPRLALAAVGAASLLTALIAVAFVPFTSAQSPAPATPAPPSTTTTPTFRATRAPAPIPTPVPPAPTFDTIPVAVPEPIVVPDVTASEIAADPQPTGSEHLSGNESGPRPPGPE